jgi:hypothetical protein
VVEDGEGFGGEVRVGRVGDERQVELSRALSQQPGDLQIGADQFFHDGWDFFRLECEPRLFVRRRGRLVHGPGCREIVAKHALGVVPGIALVRYELLQGRQD